jgi:DNA mismatch endonuclease (patch repair protein)
MGCCPGVQERVVTDRISSQARSANMARIRGRDTGPELAVRRALHRLGFRFRLHRRDLPGSPDIVLPRHRAVVFVHGCFWHRHSGCRLTTTPGTRAEFWSTKFEANVARDARAIEALEKQGWQVHVVWECQTRNVNVLTETVAALLKSGDTA